MKIESCSIDSKHQPFIIAEMSGNHNQSLERAIAIVEAAAKSGAHAIKLQTYTADSLTLDIKEGDFFISDEKSLWKGKSLYDLYTEASTPREWHNPIMKRAKELGLICFSTPFDEEAVDFLESINVPAYKIASFENTHLPLIRKIARTRKPVILSTGMASLAELGQSVQTIRKHGCHQLVLLKCTSTYPADPSDSNILTIPHMRDLFDCEVGLSDHTIGIGTALAAVAHGATVIEKHFTLSRSEGGVDSAFSMEPDEMKLLVHESRQAWLSLGKIFYQPTAAEEASLKYRRSIYFSKDLAAGESLDTDSIKIVRPGMGLPPQFYDILLGRVVKKSVKKGTAVQWELLK